MLAPLIFFRLNNGKEMWYPMEIPPELTLGKTPEEIAKDNAECNPGTIRVEDIDGQVLWPLVS